MIGTVEGILDYIHLSDVVEYYLDVSGNFQLRRKNIQGRQLWLQLHPDKNYSEFDGR